MAPPPPVFVCIHSKEDNGRVFVTIDSKELRKEPSSKLLKMGGLLKVELLSPEILEDTTPENRFRRD